MNYVKHILLPDEKILYDCHVHPKVLVPGMLILGIAAFILHEAANTGGGNSFLLNFAYWLGTHAPSTAGFYNTLARWQSASPSVALEIKVVALVVALAGFSRLMRALVLMQTTELVVTDQRVIAKMGLMTVITLEIDRRRIAGVTVDQSFLGQIMGYGSLYIQGFTTSIGGLPDMVNPHMVERFVNFK